MSRTTSLKTNCCDDRSVRDNHLAGCHGTRRTIPQPLIILPFFSAGMMAEFRPIRVVAAIPESNGASGSPVAGKVVGMVADRAKITRKFLPDRVLLMAFILIIVSLCGTCLRGWRQPGNQPIADGNQRVYANAKVCYSAAAEREKALLTGIIVYSSRIDDAENDRALSFGPVDRLWLNPSTSAGTPGGCSLSLSKGDKRGRTASTAGGAKNRATGKILISGEQ